MAGAALFAMHKQVPSCMLERDAFLGWHGSQMSDCLRTLMQSYAVCLLFQYGTVAKAQRWRMESTTNPPCAKSCLFPVQGSDKVKKLHAVTATEAQKYIASMFEVHTEVGQLRDNLREQHRIWLDFYSAVFHVCVLTPCVYDGSCSMYPGCT